MQHYTYADLPFAVFSYPPDEEWTLRWYERLGYNEKELRRYGSLLVKEL